MLRVLPVLYCLRIPLTAPSDATRAWACLRPCTTAAAGTPRGSNARGHARVPVCADASKNGSPSGTSSRPHCTTGGMCSAAEKRRHNATCPATHAVGSLRTAPATDDGTAINHSAKSRHRVLAVSTTALGPTEGYSAVLTGSKAPGQTRTCALAGSTARFATKSDLFPNDDLGRGCAVCVRLRVRTSRDRLADPKTPGASAQG